MNGQRVEKLSDKAARVAARCRVLGVSRSGYFGLWQRTQEAPQVCTVSVQLQAGFAASGHVDGSRRLGAVMC